jgi:NADPH-dependent stearoyl-CoA 9-desaturase
MSSSFTAHPPRSNASSTVSCGSSTAAIEELGRKFDELHDQVKADLGERDARYIHGIIDLQRRLALLGRLLLIGSRFRPLWLLGTASLSTAKILENMEIGHNVLHGQ